MYCLQNTNWQFAQWLILIHLSHLVISLLCKLSTVLTCHPLITGHAILSKKYNNLKLIYLPQAALQTISSNERVFISCCCFCIEFDRQVWKGEKHLHLQQIPATFFLFLTLKLSFMCIVRICICKPGMTFYMFPKEVILVVRVQYEPYRIFIYLLTSGLKR